MNRYGRGVSILLVVAGMSLIGIRVAKSSTPVGGAMPAATVQVKIDNFTFAPSTLTVVAGTTVEWINRDDIPHTVVSEDKTTFKSKALDTDDKFSYTFTKAGEYPYFCSIHPKMVAKVVVQ